MTYNHKTNESVKHFWDTDQWVWFSPRGLSDSYTGLRGFGEGVGVWILSVGTDRKMDRKKEWRKREKETISTDL